VEYYESRLAKLDFNREEIARLNKNVEEDISAKESAKSKWAELGSRDLIVPS